MVIDLGAQTLVDALADAVRDRVISGALVPGSRVTEQDVANLYGVARPTAKAAIERVVQSGILRRTANKTARVPLLSPEDIRDLYLSRVIFERDVVASLAARKVIPADAESAVADMRRALESDSLTDMAASDIRFHRALVDAAGSPRMSRMYETIIGEAQLCMAQEQAHSDLDRSTNIDEHMHIIAALREGDSESATALLVAHLTSAAERLLGRPLDLGGWL